MKMQSLTLSLLVFSSFACKTLLAQTTPAPQTSTQQSDAGQGSILFHQETNNVLIDVIAVDKHGKPVTSLDKSQFTLTENGKPQTIAFFEEHDPARDAAPAPAPTLPQLPAGEYTNIEFVPNRGPLIILLADALNSSPTDMAMLRQHLKKYIDQIPAGSHVAIFSLTDKLRLIQRFTEDPAVLQAALQKHGKNDPSNHMTDLSDATADRVFASEVGLNQFFAASESNYIHEDHRAIILDALRSLSSYLKELPGRKDLVWFAGDWSWVPLPHPHQSSELDELPLDNEQLSDLFVESRVALYPVDVRGLVPMPGFNPAGGGTPSTGRFGGGNVGGEVRAENDLGDRHLWMNQIAFATGGRAIFDTNGVAQALSRAESESEHYYTLAYSPGSPSENGGFRHIEIKVATPGIKLEYRAGYYAQNAKDSAREREKFKSPLTPVMQFGGPNYTQIPFHIELALASQQPDLTESAKRIGVEAAKLKSPPIRYRFTWHVNLQHLQLTPGPDGLEHGKLTACLAAYDTDGKLLNHITGNLAFKISPADVIKYRDSGMPITQSFDLPAGHIFIRAGLVDPDTARTGATEFAISVAPVKSGVAQLN